MANGWFTDSEVTGLHVYSKFVRSIYLSDLWKALPHAAPPCWSLQVTNFTKVLQMQETAKSLQDW